MCYRYGGYDYDNGVRGTRDSRNRIICNCREVRGDRDSGRGGYQWFSGNRGRGNCGCGCGHRRQREFRCVCREVD